MQDVCVARLLRSTTAFCSSIAHERDHGVSAPSLQMPGTEIEHIPGKRKGVETLGEYVRSGKKAKSGLQTLQVSRDCSSLVGRLQLCNKKRHSWGGLSPAGDCLAFTDSTGSICCSISRELDISFIGKLVRVNSWSLIPINDTRGPTKPSSGPLTGKAIRRISVTEGITSKGNSNFLAQDSEFKNLTRGAPENATDVWNGNDAVDGSGFLEIHNLELLERQDIRVATFPSVCVDSAAADIRNALFESPLIKKGGERSRLTICGKLQSVSPQFSLPCNFTDDRDATKASSEVGASSKENRQKAMNGFLVELNYCHSCSCQYMDCWTMGTQKESRRGRQLFEHTHSSDGANSKHGVYGDQDDIKYYRNPLHVFFSGSLASWRPILSVSINHCLTISGLRKKLVLTGSGRAYQLLLVATRTSLILPVLDPHHRNVRECCTSGRRDSERKREDSERISAEGRSNHPRVISYAGFVTSVLFQGALVELDEHVWLLFTHQGKSQLHGLRVGAMLALRDVHAIIIHNPSEQVLLLGACIRSHVSVLLFSPLHSPPLNQLQSPSLLLRYMRKVSFTSAFWILSLIGSFRQKFRGIYSHKELMGSKKDPGIILEYVQKLLAPDNSLERPDYFKEFCDHEHISCSGGSVSSVILSKVPPISNFIEASLQCSKSRVCQSSTSGSTYFQRWLEKKSLLSSLEVSLASWQFAHSIISSQELGVTLLGSLQVCQRSGQLQLMDATGFVYVVVPDLFSSTHLYKTYQISSFTLVVKELAEDDSDVIGKCRCEGARDSSVSWSSLLKDSKPVLGLSPASELLVHFYLRDAILVDTLSFSKGMVGSSSQGWKQRRLDQKHTTETGNRMELDLETVSTWLEQRISELGSVMSLTRDLKLLCDSAGGLNLPNEQFRVSCKVVAVDFVVFHCQGPTLSKNRLSSKSPQRPDLELNDDDWLLSLGIPLTLASVVVGEWPDCPPQGRCLVLLISVMGTPLLPDALLESDDGYGLAHCWALGDVAASLLGLLKTSGQTELHPNLLGRLGDKYGRSDRHLTMMRCICCLVRRYGQIVLRSQRPHAASVDFSCPLQWCGSNSPDCDDQAFMQAVVAGACHNAPLVVTLGNIPRAVKGTPESEKSPWESCRALAYRAGVQSSRLQDKEWPQLFATKVESAVLLSDVRAVSDEVATLLKNEL